MESYEISTAPTDMMHRRIPLPFRGRFLWLGTSLTIKTDSQAILRAAEGVGFLQQDNFERELQMQWEIATEPSCEAATNDWACKVTVDNHSLFLSMGVGQWFAFDFESGEGAGFVTACDASATCDSNAAKYLLEIVSHIGHCLRGRSERSCWP
jgi:hypothetical protein